MKVAVCIVSYRTPADVVRCLEALALSEHADFEVVVCENGGAAAARDLAARIPARLAGGQAVRLVVEPDNPGFAGGVNRCLREAPGAGAWWVLNPDTVPQPQALAAMAARLAAGDCHAVGGPLLLSGTCVQSYGGAWRAWLARAVSLGHGGDPAAAPAAELVERRQNYLNGASMLVSRRFVDAVGPMREDYFLYCEEVEWCLRAAKAGLRLGFAPRGVVLHDQGSSTGHTASLRGRSRLSVYLNERNRLLLTRDVYPARLPVAAAFALAILTVRYARGRAWRELGHAAAGWLAGLRNERGRPAA